MKQVNSLVTKYSMIKCSYHDSVFHDSVPVSAMQNELYVMTSELLKHEGYIELLKG